MKDTFKTDKSMRENVGKYPVLSHITCFKGPVDMCPTHYHRHIEILYGIKGHCTIYLDGKQYEFMPDEMVVINSDVVHRIYGNDEINSYLVIKLDLSVIYEFQDTSPEIKYVIPFLMHNLDNKYIFTKDDLKDSDIKKWLFAINDEYNLKMFGYEIAMKSNAINVFLWILRCWNPGGSDDLYVYNNRIEKAKTALDFIHENYMNQISIIDIAEKCNMNYSYFSRFFKSYAKQSFNDYLNYVRISKAKKLLSSTNLSISDVAEKVGFTSSSYFISKFKKRAGLTPAQFREIYTDNNYEKHK